MNNGIYSGNSQHEIELRKRYDEIFKIIGEKVGFTNFNYQKYKNDRLPAHQKDEFEKELEKEITNLEDDKVKNALNFINNSFLVSRNHDKITDIKSFKAFGEKTIKSEVEKEGTRTTATETSASPTSSGEKVEDEYDSDMDEEEMLDSRVEKVFPGYDKKLTFFAAIKKAYQERKEKTNSRFLGILSGIRAGISKFGPIGTGVMLGAIASILIFGGTTPFFMGLARNVLLTLLGARTVGAIWQELEDGKLERGFFAWVKKKIDKRKAKNKKDTGETKGKHEMERDDPFEVAEEEPEKEAEKIVSGPAFPNPTATPDFPEPALTGGTPGSPLGEPDKKTSNLSQPSKEDDDADYMYYGSLPTYYKEDDDEDYLNYGNMPYKPTRKVDDAEMYQLYGGAYNESTAEEMRENLRRNEEIRNKNIPTNEPKNKDSENLERKEEELESTLADNKRKKELITNLRNILKRLNSAKETSLKYDNTIIELFKKLNMSDEEMATFLNKAGLDDEDIKNIIEQAGIIAGIINKEKGEVRGK